MTVTSMRHMMLSADRHDPHYDLRHLGRPMTLLEIQAGIVKGTPEQRVIIYENMLEYGSSLILPFLASFETGFTPSAEIVQELVKHNITRPVPDAWQAMTLFDDDDNFIAARFYIMVDYHANMGSLGDWAERALAQGKRMLAAGRVDPRYLRMLPMLRGTVDIAAQTLIKDLADFERELQVYLPHGLAAIEERLNLYVTFLAGQPSKQMENEVARTQAQLDQAMGERERLFHEVWLPAVLNPAEWATVQSAPRSLLRDLYGNLWEQGYAAYHAVRGGR